MQFNQINSRHFSFGDQSTYPLTPHPFFHPLVSWESKEMWNIDISLHSLLHLEPCTDLGQTGGQHAERGWSRPHHHHGLARLTDSSEYFYIYSQTPLLLKYSHSPIYSSFHRASSTSPWTICTQNPRCSSGSRRTFQSGGIR